MTDKSDAEIDRIAFVLGDVITEKTNLLHYTILNNRKEMESMAAINISKEQFEQLIYGEKPVLVDFWAPWCGFCRRIASVYDKIAEEYRGILVVGKVNIDEESNLADMEQIEVIPTLVLYRNGKAVGSIVAPESKAMINQFIKESLEKGVSEK